MLRSVLAVLAILLVSAAAPPERPPAVEYEVSPRFEAGALAAVHIEVTFRGASTGETSLALPNEWGGEQELWRYIRNLRVVLGATIRDGGGPANRVLIHRPGARVRIAYDVVSGYDDDPVEDGRNPYKPIVRPTYFHLIGYASLIVPNVGDDSPVRFRVRGMPRNWTFASDLEDQNVRLNMACNSVLVGGDFRMLTAPRGDIRIAIRGAWKFSDVDFARDVEDILTAQRVFWRDAPSPFLVTVIPLKARNENSSTTGGTGVVSAFAFFTTPNASPEIIKRTLGHEAMHRWIPAQIGGMHQQNEPADYWLSEGFTDFYMARLLVRQGAWGPREFADELNGALSDYAHSPVRLAPNARIVADFWNDADVRRLPYLRGRLLAIAWDARLRATGRSLDDVMRDCASAPAPTARTSP